MLVSPSSTAIVNLPGSVSLPMLNTLPSYVKSVSVTKSPVLLPTYTIPFSSKFSTTALASVARPSVCSVPLIIVLPATSRSSVMLMP